MRTPGVPLRRGARRLQDVPPGVLAELEAGEPSVNHIEQMAMNMSTLMRSAFPAFAHRSDELALPRFLDRLRHGGRILWEEAGPAAFELAMGASSDTVRGVGCVRDTPERSFGDGPTELGASLRR